MSVQALREYIAKTEISEHRPWMLQQLLRGREYSSYSVAHEGQLVMHSDNEACLSCLDYAHINSKQVDSRKPSALLLAVHGSSKRGYPSAKHFSS